MKYDITHALTALKPGAQWTLNGEDYTGLNWLDSEQQPTKQEISVSYTHLTLPTILRV